MNYYRAEHKVHVLPGVGTCVKLYYKGFEVSLAMDGGDTIVFSKADEKLFTAISTSGEAVKLCFDYIDSL